MSRMQKMKGLVAASLRLKTINDNPLNMSQVVTSEEMRIVRF